MRKIEERDIREIEDIVQESAKHVGMNLPIEASPLLLRLIFSGIARYFFFEPDVAIKMGFMEFRKSPDIDELFTVNILRSGKDGVVNADTLWQYYKGDLAREKQLKEALDAFVKELLNYSQAQEQQISRTTSNLNTKRRTKNGIQKK